MLNMPVRFEVLSRHIPRLFTQMDIVQANINQFLCKKTAQLSIISTQYRPPFKTNRSFVVFDHSEIIITIFSGLKRACS